MLIDKLSGQRAHRAETAQEGKEKDGDRRENDGERRESGRKAEDSETPDARSPETMSRPSLSSSGEECGNPSRSRRGEPSGSWGGLRRRRKQPTDRPAQSAGREVERGVGGRQGTRGGRREEEPPQERKSERPGEGIGVDEGVGEKEKENARPEERKGMETEPSRTSGEAPVEFRIFSDVESTEYFFIFVNPASGGNAAAALLDLGFNYCEFVLPREPAVQSPTAKMPALAPAQYGHSRSRPSTERLRFKSSSFVDTKSDRRSDTRTNTSTGPPPPDLFEPFTEPPPQKLLSNEDSEKEVKFARERGRERLIGRQRAQTAESGLGRKRTPAEFTAFDKEEDRGGTKVKVFVSNIASGEAGNKDAFHILKAVAHTKQALRPASSSTSSNSLSATGPEECHVRLMVAGGDGTLMWAFSELERHKIRKGAVWTGIVPFGTGNDFANAMRCKYEIRLPGEAPIQALKRLTRHWLKLRPARFDLWAVEMECDAKEGFFEKIDSQTRRKRIICHEPTTTLEGSSGSGSGGGGDMRKKKIQFALANYFSLGVESRIGVGFDRNRTKSVVLNKGTYALEGFKKLAFHRTRFINNYIDRFTVQDGPENAEETIFRCAPQSSRLSAVKHSIKHLFTSTQDVPANLPPGLSPGLQHHPSSLPPISTPSLPPSPSNTPRSAAVRERKDRTERREERVGKKTVTLSDPYSASPSPLSALISDSEAEAEAQTRTQGDSEIERESEGESPVPILTPCVSMCFLNISSFGGGLDLWNASKDKLGASLPESQSRPGTGRRCARPTWRRMCEAAHSTFQDSGDGELEILCFKSLMDFSLTNLQRLLPSDYAPATGWRLYQGGGTFRIHFVNTLSKDARVYFQIDGEYFIAHKPRTVTISPDSQVNVLVDPTAAFGHTHTHTHTVTDRRSLTGASRTSSPKRISRPSTSGPSTIERPSTVERPSSTSKTLEISGTFTRGGTSGAQRRRDSSSYSRPATAPNVHHPRARRQSQQGNEGQDGGRRPSILAVASAQDFQRTPEIRRQLSPRLSALSQARVGDQVLEAAAEPSLAKAIAQRVSKAFTDTSPASETTANIPDNFLVP